MPLVTVVHPNGTIERRWRDDGTPQEAPAIRTITTQRFFRRLTRSERSVLREGASDILKDIKEDLGRSPTVDLDGYIKQQLKDLGLSVSRREELLRDG